MAGSSYRGDTTTRINTRLCMSGSIHYRKDRACYFIAWYDKRSKKTVKIYRYNGETIYSKKVAQKLLFQMQATVETGHFILERFTKQGFTDIMPFIHEWMENISPTLSPATRKGYQSYIKNHIAPYFGLRKDLQLEDIQLDILTAFMNRLPLAPKGKMNVMYCLHAILDYAKRSRRIIAMPSFPKKSQYQYQEPAIRWLPEHRQLKILEKIPLEHQPIFFFLKYHLRRPAEAIALQKEDFQEDRFTIRRSISARQVVDKTKTGEIHIIPCLTAFKPYLEIEYKKPFISNFLFKCPSARNKDKRYSNEILNRIWKKACKAAGEDIDMYSGLKHSSCSQYINEKGLSESELQIITDHSRIESVKRYAKTEIKRKKELFETPIIEFQNHVKKAE